MKRAGNLFYRVASFTTLLAAADRAARGKTGRPEVGRFFLNLEHEILSLQSDLLSGDYQPGPYRCFRIRDPKPRQICAAPFRDRVFQQALCAVVEPIFECSYIHDSYACRMGKGSHRALLRAQRFARGRRHFLKLDIRRFFHSIDHARLKAAIARRIKDRKVLDLLDRVIDHPALGLGGGKGLPIGNLCSQHLANLYLDSLDHWIQEDLRIGRYLRYMDDMLLFGDDKAKLREALRLITERLSTELELRVKERATVLAPVDEGVPWLGFRVFPGLIRVKAVARARFRKKIRRRQYELKRGSIGEEKYRASLRSLFEHLGQGDTRGLRLAVLDG